MFCFFNLINSPVSFQVYFCLFSVGLNCTIENCDETPICPPDSELVDGRTCACVPDRCLPVPDCQYKSKPVLKLEAAGIPGDCCDVYDCVFPTGNPQLLK